MLIDCSGQLLLAVHTVKTILVITRVTAMGKINEGDTKAYVSFSDKSRSCSIGLTPLYISSSYCPQISSANRKFAYLNNLLDLQTFRKCGT